MLTICLSAPGDLVANNLSRVALHVCFTVDGDADASGGGGRAGGEGGGGEAGGVAMVL